MSSSKCGFCEVFKLLFLGAISALMVAMFYSSLAIWEHSKMNTFVLFTSAFLSVLFVLRFLVKFLELALDCCNPEDPTEGEISDPSDLLNSIINEKKPNCCVSGLQCLSSLMGFATWCFFLGWSIMGAIWIGKADIDSNSWFGYAAYVCLGVSFVSWAGLALVVIFLLIFCCCICCCIAGINNASKEMENEGKDQPSAHNGLVEFFGKMAGSVLDPKMVKNLKGGLEKMGNKKEVLKPEPVADVKVLPVAGPKVTEGNAVDDEEKKGLLKNE